MIKDDAQLIHRTLSGDEAAFNTLVQKYQKGVHAFAWRKIDDYHFAEEITQDTFLQAYKKLATLRNPKQFSTWLYVIVNRLCINWIRRKKPAMQSLEHTHVDVVGKFSYACYISEQRETQASEHRHEIIHNLLRRLPENERRVMMLYYFSEMKIKEIGVFLGVSVNTIKSQLRRARKRLQEREEHLILELIGDTQSHPVLSIPFHNSRISL